MSREPSTGAELLTLGKVGKPHGLHGAFFVAGRDEPIPLVYRDILIGLNPQTARPARLIESKMQAGRPLVRCSAAGNREAAQELTGQWIYVPREQAVGAARGTWIWGELIGVELIGSDGAPLGRIEYVYNSGASDIAHVRDGRGRRIELPLVSDYFDFAASLDGRRLTLSVPTATFDELWEKDA